MVRILVIDDDADGADALADLLELSGFAVERAYSGVDGVARAGAMEPDIVVLDLNMPGIDGWETARRIKAARGAGGLRIIAYSGSASVPLQKNPDTDDIECIVSKGSPAHLLLEVIANAPAAASTLRT